jgi:GT2 family glycosyltransferase
MNGRDEPARAARDTASRLWTVVLGFNGFEDTRRCLASLAAINGGPPPTVYVDNASSGDVAGAVQAAFPWCHVVRNQTNDGYAGGNNRGIAYALEHGADLVLVLNNDTIVGPGLLETMADASERYPHFGIIGPVIGFMEDPGVVRTDGCLINRRATQGFFGRHVVPLGAGGECRVHETDIVNGACMMIRSRVLGRTGPFDEKYFLVHEESDLCLRARAAGFHVGVIDRMLVWHKGSSSFKRTGRRLQKYFDIRNLFVLLKSRRPFGGERRSALQSWLLYWRHAYHMFCLEHEAGEASAAIAVLEGLEDAIAGRTGPYQPRRRRLVAPLGQLFSLIRAVKTRLPSPAPAPVKRP